MTRTILVAALALACGGPGATFRITPVRPVAELLPDALAAQPPVEEGEFRPADLVEVVLLDAGIQLDIRYATDNNFLGTPLYSEARAFLQRPAAEAAVRAHRGLAAVGYGILIHDAYRPWHVTKVFWDATPPEYHDFVAGPRVGLAAQPRLCGGPDALRPAHGPSGSYAERLRRVFRAGAS